MDVKTVSRFVVETTVFVSVFAVYNFINDLVPLTKRGFVCGDPSLSLPLKKNSVGSIWLYFSIYPPPFIIWLVELALHAGEFRTRFKDITWQSLVYLKNYYIVFMCLIISMTTLKNMMGSQRPFFFEVCKPDSMINCTVGTFMTENYECTNANMSKVMFVESQKSFPSGHVIVSVYPCFFFMWYLQTRLSKVTPVLLTLIHLLGCLFISICSITRITDHWHHPADVIGGFVLTLPFVYHACHVLSKDFGLKGCFSNVETEETDEDMTQRISTSSFSIQ